MPVASQAAPAPATSTPTAQPSEGALDKILKGIVRFFAKIMGQPDPITGVSNATSATAQKAENIIGKVWGAANQVVEKASDVAGKAVNTVNQATEKIQQVIPQQPVAPTAPVESTQPVQPAPVQQPAQVTPPTV
ncbi:MAG: hypothetical protein WCP92_10010 [bacterium]